MYSMMNYSTEFNRVTQPRLKESSSGGYRIYLKKQAAP